MYIQYMNNSQDGISTIIQRMMLTLIKEADFVTTHQ